MSHSPRTETDRFLPANPRPKQNNNKKNTYPGRAKTNRSINYDLRCETLIKPGRGRFLIHNSAPNGAQTEKGKRKETQQRSIVEANRSCDNFGGLFLVFILSNSFSYSCVIWTFFFAAIYSPTPIGTICEDKRSLIFYSLIHDTASARWQPDGGKELKTYLKTNQKYCDSNCNNRALLLSGATIKITSYKNRARPFDPFFLINATALPFILFFSFFLSIKHCSSLMRMAALSR